MLDIKPHVYLISDSTGETVSIVARSVYARFEKLDPIEKKWALIRTEYQLKNVIGEINKNPGLVLYTMINKNLEDILIREYKNKDDVTLVPILNPIIDIMKKAFHKTEAKSQIPGKQHEMDRNYFNRIEALHYAVANDDGQITKNIKDADIILIGVSRTSKTPTSIYLANKGFKVANIPIILDQEFNLEIDNNNTLVIGLFASKERLLQIRKSRLTTLNEKRQTSYVDLELVKKEILQARRLCVKNSWPSIDVSRRSIEEVAAAVIEQFKKFRDKSEKKQ